MSTLENSIAMKGRAAKPPALSGLPPASPKETPSNNAGKSVQDTKAIKNAGSGAESKFTDQVQAINQKYTAPGIKLNSPGVSPLDKTYNHF